MTQLRYTAPIYEDHLNPNGLLPREIKERSSAAWHFAKLAHVALSRVPEQVVMEGDTDLTVELHNLARSIVIQYGLKSIEDIMTLMDFVKAEALRVGLSWSGRLDAWLATGGKSYNFVTREEKAWSQEQ